MRMVNFDQHVQEVRGKARRYQLMLRNHQTRRVPRRRARDAAMLDDRIQLALRRREEWLASGRLTKLGERHYRLSLDW